MALANPDFAVPTGSREALVGDVVVTLIEHLRSGIERLCDAADQVDDPRLKALFCALVHDREQAIETLSPSASWSVHTPSGGWTIGNAARRGVIQVRARMGDSGDIFLNEAARAQDDAIEAMETAIDGLPAGAARYEIETLLGHFTARRTAITMARRYRSAA